MPSPARAFLASLGAMALSLSACAHAPAAREAATTPEKTELRLVTGSHIPQPVDPRTDLPATMSPVQIYTRDDLARTGMQGDLAAALRRLEVATSPVPR